MTTSTLHTITHRYPWTGEERLILAVLLLGPAAVTLWQVSRSGFDPVTASVLHVIGLGAAAALWRLGARRKNRSAISATLRGTRLEVSGGRVKASRGDIAGTRAVTTQQLGPETVLVLTRAGGAAVKVPTRITDDPQLAAVLREHLLRDGVSADDEAREILRTL